MNNEELLSTPLPQLLKLAEEVGIDVKEGEDHYQFNYNQINSPKTDSFVMMCRGLIISKTPTPTVPARNRILCRPFDRFFNYGEALNITGDYDLSNFVCYEKVDGSLIKVYHDGNSWKFGTKGTPYALTPINNWEDITFQDIVLRALGCSNMLQFNTLMETFGVSKGFTHLFELVSKYNRVVIDYKCEPTLYYLMSINNEFCEGCDFRHKFEDMVGVKFPKKYSFNSVEEILKSAHHLPFDDEGYVVYINNIPKLKMKSPAYVALHRIRDNGGLRMSSAIDIVSIFEEDEYLIMFPEDAEFLNPLVQRRDQILKEMEELWVNTKHIEDQKEFAMHVKDKVYAGIMFTKRKNPEVTIKQLFGECQFNARERLLRSI